MKMADIQSPWMKSGIQALEHKYPDKPVTPGKAAHMEFEYSCAVTPQVRQTGNRLSGLAGTAYASLLT